MRVMDLRERRRILVRAPGKARISVSNVCVASRSKSTSFFGIAIHAARKNSRAVNNFKALNAKDIRQGTL